jgi:general secretion pathway protein G
MKGVCMSTTLKNGFSLMEIMIAVAIMGLLASIAIPNLMGYMQKANKEKTTQHLNLFKSSITQYYADTGRFPRALDDLMDKPDSEDPLAKKWQGPYIESKGGGLPQDGWGQDFVYELTPGAAHPYELYSYGPEGEDAPEDDRISVW